MEKANAVIPQSELATTPSFTLKIAAIAGTEEAKDSATLWTGRIVGKQPRKDLMLSQPLPQLNASWLKENITDEQLEKVAIILNDEFAAYVRRVKCQRMDIGSTIELTMPLSASDFASMLVNMLSAPATHIKKLVSTASVRAMLLTEDYKRAVLAVIPEAKRDTWKRIGEREMMPLATAQDPTLSTARAAVRDNVVMRLAELAEVMPAGENRSIMEALAELLADIKAQDLEDSI